MKKLFIIIILTTGIYSVCFSQNNLCNSPDAFCSGITYNFPAPVNAGNAEIGPDYGCLNNQPNPVWYYIQTDQPGNISIDIHSVPQHDIDFICWGPFTTLNGACNELSLCSANLDSHNASGPGGGYPLFNTVDCSGSASWQEWCYIPNAQTGEYFILLITNYSNQSCNIILNQTNLGQAGAGTTSCWNAGCYISNLTRQFESCNTLANTFSLVGKITFQGIPSCGQCLITDQPSGISQTFNFPYEFISYSLTNIPMDGLEHTLSVYFSGNPTASFTDNYIAPNSCYPCTANAGANIIVCGLQASLNAIELPTDSNTHWLSENGICFSSINSTNSIAIADTFGTFNIIWQITDSSNFLCTDTLMLEFVDPALCTSVFENKVFDNFTIFPNPVVNSIFTINYSSKLFDKFSINLINTQGVNVYSKFMSKNTESIEIQIDTSEIINGYYIVEINDGQKIIRKSLVVQNIY